MYRSRPTLTAALFAAALLATVAPPAAQEAPYDIVIAGGTIVDGSGAPGFAGDIGVRGGRLATIGAPGSLREANTEVRIDATGHVVAPGFMDIQSQSRWAFLWGDGRSIGKISQGITTEIMGEGTTDAPRNERNLRLIGLPEDEEQRAIVESFAEPEGFSNWLEAMERHGVSPNIGSFVGASTLRMYGRGMRMGDASEGELDEMRGAVERAMLDGAFGIATALIYPPGNYASTEELIELARAMAPFDGLYITHLRSEADHFLEGIDEAIRIGREAGVAVEIYHLKAAGERNWGKAQPALDRIEAARADGLDIEADMYPYVAGATSLSAVFPPWASEGGGLNRRLRDPETFARIKAEVLSDDTEWENLAGASGPANVVVNGIGDESLARFNGMDLEEIGAELGVDWVDAAAQIVSGGGAGMVIFMMSEDNVRLYLRQPWMKFGTDASGVNPAAMTRKMHPRTYGTFPRIMGRYVRDEGLMAIEDAVRKASWAVAERLGIRERGKLVQGWHADVVIFDPATIADRATFDDPHQLSVGVRDVLVNGTRVWADGQHTGAKPGRVVRGPGWRGRRTP
jgi:dihydroorotase/N-acyl-D-amino-acid deacylase